MRALVVAFLMVSTILAGCADKADPVDECNEDIVLCNPEQYYGDHYCEQNDVRPRVYAPDTDGPDTDPDPWVLGDSWTYSLAIDGEDLGETQLIYYDIQDGGAHYMVGTPTREEALQHAIFSTNPVIGRVHKTLYSPHESGAHADMFNFPLCAGNTWQDTFFDTPFTFTAHRQSIQLPDGRTDPLAFRIDGIAADGSTVTTTYSPQAKWFTRIDLNRADGTTVAMELTRLGRGYDGEAYFLRGQKDFVEPIEHTGSGNLVHTVVGRDGDYDRLGIYLDVERTSGTGRVEVLVRYEDGASLACVGFSGPEIGGTSDCPEGPILVDVPFRQGNVNVQIQRSLTGGETTVEGEVRLVSIFDRSCTVGGNCGA